MRLDRFWIGDYKNLKDVTVDFDEDHWITVLIGWNGTGKSNVIEALATLFRDLVMRENENKQKNRPSFEYRIAYHCRDHIVHIDAKPQREKTPYIIHVRSLNDEKSKQNIHQILPYTKDIDEPKNLGERVSLSKFLRDDGKYLPKYIFGYYSGYSNRMEQVFRKYLSRYDQLLRGGKDPGLRRLFYALPVHSQFVLLAFILQQDDVVNQFLDKHLGLDEKAGIDSVLFIIRQPPWTSKAPDGDPRFWNARGVVKDFLSRLYAISLAPIRLNYRVDTTLWNKKSREFLYLYVKDLETLRKLVGNQAPREFFRDLESTYVSELIEEVRIRVKLRKNDGAVTFRELSEGEQQLLTVLGLLCFTAEDESLFLLDEPDTHLNPKWSVDYLQYLHDFVGTGESKRENSHVVLTTHNPLAIAELSKEQVQILKRDKDSLSVASVQPDIDPRGMGYSGIVTSDMFGLATALDSHTQKLLETKRKLAGKEGPLTDDERNELEYINLELEGYGFRYETRDPVFAEYLKARYEYDVRQPSGEKITELSAGARREKARHLIQRALKKVDKEH